MLYGGKVMTKEITYTVRGFWPFPVDMLRHDGSRAASPEDQATIDRLSGEHAPDRAAFQNVDIILVGPRKPNTARWESFSWAVPSDREHAMYKRWESEAKEEARLLEGALAKLTVAERSLVKSRMGGRP
jgi:hypothetical protein